MVAVFPIAVRMGNQCFCGDLLHSSGDDVIYYDEQDFDRCSLSSLPTCRLPTCTIFGALLPTT